MAAASEKKLTYVWGNLLETKLPYIAHGCNCRGSMGAGVALRIANKWPIVKEEYLIKFNKEGWKLGDVQAVKASDTCIVLNCATQSNYGRTGQFADYDAIRHCMRNIKALIGDAHQVAMPQIGAGFGGGDWNVIEKIIFEELGTQAVVYVV